MGGVQGKTLEVGSRKLQIKSQLKSGEATPYSLIHTHMHYTHTIASSSSFVFTRRISLNCPHLFCIPPD